MSIRRLTFPACREIYFQTFSRYRVETKICLRTKYFNGVWKIKASRTESSLCHPRFSACQLQSQPEWLVVPPWEGPFDAAADLEPTRTHTFSVRSFIADGSAASTVKSNARFSEALAVSGTVRGTYTRLLLCPSDLCVTLAVGWLVIHRFESPCAEGTIGRHRCVRTRIGVSGMECASEDIATGGALSHLYFPVCHAATSSRSTAKCIRDHVVRRECSLY